MSLGQPGIHGHRGTHSPVIRFFLSLNVNEEQGSWRRSVSRFTAWNLITRSRMRVWENLAGCEWGDGMFAEGAVSEDFGEIFDCSNERYPPSSLAGHPVVDLAWSVFSSNLHFTTRDPWCWFMGNWSKLTDTLFVSMPGFTRNPNGERPTAIRNSAAFPVSKHKSSLLYIYSEICHRKCAELMSINLSAYVIDPYIDLFNLLKQLRLDQIFNSSIFRNVIWNKTQNDSLYLLIYLVIFHLLTVRKLQ